jgi:hypothetical protein
MTALGRSPVTKLGSLLLFAAVLAGCGSSSSLSSNSSQSVSAQTSPASGTSAQTASKSGEAKQPRAGKAKLHATVYGPGPKGKQSGATGTGTTGQDSAPGQNPCTFVTRSEAEAILHAQLLRQIEAPQGPTCILEVKGQKQSITLAVQAINLPRYIAQMKTKPTQLVIGGNTAYCGRLGTSLLLVELGGGRVLQVVAPCAAAEALAAKALPRIKA